MPRKDINYSKCKIYKIVCKDIDVPHLYVGHTTHFPNRKQSHKTVSNDPNHKLYNCQVYRVIREFGGWDNWQMVLVEHYPCNDVLEATARERYWFELLQADLNTNVPSRTFKEWYAENKELHCANQRAYDRVRIQCACGVTHARGNSFNHRKTKRHQNFISSNSIQNAQETTSL